MVELTFDKERVPLRVTDGSRTIEGLLELAGTSLGGKWENQVRYVLR